MKTFGLVSWLSLLAAPLADLVDIPFAATASLFFNLVLLPELFLIGVSMFSA